MNAQRKEEIEKCVVEIECINNSTKDKEFGTGFFIDNKTVATASHVIKYYYSDAANCTINVMPSKFGISTNIKVVKVLNEKNEFISILELEESIENIKTLKFISGYEIKWDDEYFTFGHPICKRRGYPIENKIQTNIKEFQSDRADWDLQLIGDRADDYKGFSGAPIIIKDMLVGIIQTQTISEGKAISLAMSSINIMKDFILDKYCQKYDDILKISELKEKFKDKIQSIGDIDEYLRNSTQQVIGLDFFEIDDDEFKRSFKEGLNQNTYVIGKSREETLYCLLNELSYVLNCSNVIIVKDEEAWERLNGEITGFVLIPNFYVGEIVAIAENINIFIFGEDEHCTNINKIELKKRIRANIINKLQKAGLDSSIAYSYVEKTNGLFISLKRKLFNGQYNIKPTWSSPKSNSFIVALLCGKWTECDGDKAVIEELSGKSYDEFMNDLVPFSKGGEPFVIEIHRYSRKTYQLASTEIAWEYLEEKVAKGIWDKFKEISYKVITKIDPIFNIPFDDHYKAFIYSEKPVNSDELKYGMLRTMTFKGIFRNNEKQYEIDKIIKEILDTIRSLELWGYFSQFFTDLCEASPKAVIERLENEVKNPTGLKELFNSGNNTDMIMGKHYYTNVLWAVEQLLLHKEYAPRAVKWLFAIDDMNLKYKISNSPKTILEEVFCVWFNVSALTLQEKVLLANYAIKKYKNTWDLLFNELPGKQKTISVTLNSSKYRQCDEVKQAINNEMHDTYIVFAKLCIDNINEDIDRWVKMIEEFSKLPDDMFGNLLNKLDNDIKKMNDINKSAIKDKLRDELYRQRYFLNLALTMNKERMKIIEELYDSINFDDKVYKYLYLFKNGSDISILNPVPYDENDEKFTSMDKNKELVEKEVEKAFEEIKRNGIDLEHLIETVKKENYI